MCVCIFVVGVVVFNLYYKVLGESIIFPFQHCIHHKIDLFRCRRNENQTSPIYLLIYFGVDKSRARMAYGMVKKFVFEDDISHIQMEHSYVHLFYITAVGASVQSGISLFSGSSRASLLWLSFSTFILCLSIMADTKLHSDEGRMITAREDEVRNFLRDRRFTK